jgi:hypothetical protein
MGKRLNIVAIIILMLLQSVLFLNCSKSPSDSDSQGSQNSVDLVKLGTSSFSLDTKSYIVENYKLEGRNGPIYFQVLPGCTDHCPVVVVSMPYNGIPWTADPKDIQWSNSLPGGGLTLDVDGPGYLDGSGQQIAYYHSSIQETVGFGGMFLPSNVTAVLVYNRFYLGRKMDDYVSDFTQVVDSLGAFPFIDQKKMGFLGASLGGFVSLHASAQTMAKPLAVAGITPLIDLKAEQIEMSTVSSRITSNSSLLQSSQNFYNSYLRRMSGVDVEKFTANKLATNNRISDILVIHDTWDTIVSIQQYENFRQQRPVDAFIFQHASPIDYNNFSMDHAQSIEGYSNQKTIPVYMSYLLARLKPASEEKIIYYSSQDFLMAMSEVKLAQNRGQSINWIRGLFNDLCNGGFVLKDYSPVGNLGTLSGEQMAGGLIVNVWSQQTTIENGCNFFRSNPQIFD